MAEHKEEKFSYTYAAPTARERREIEEIRRQYMPAKAEGTALEQLKKLDRRVHKVPVVAAACTGTVGTLVFGLGMAMVLEWALTAGGIAVAAVGAVMAVCAYFVNRGLRAKLKDKYGPEILRLSEKILQGGRAEAEQK